MTNELKPLPVGATIGIIGGGQLARMLASEAFPLGYKIAIFEPQKDCPASQMTNKTFCANYDDEKSLIEFAKACDVITYEFENIPVSAAKIIEQNGVLRPSSLPLEMTQDRLTEKTFINSVGLKTAPFAEINNKDDFLNSIEKIGLPCILKTRRMGYDGKGQVVVKSIDEIDEALAAIKNAPAIIEGMVEFDFETSIILTRRADGEILYFPNSQNIHRGGILRKSIVPAPLSDELVISAQNIGKKIADALGYIGTLAVELFVGKNGLVVNEIAPRVHNSGHWTIEGCRTSQFAAHIRAICDLPLGSSALNAPNIEMNNLIGDEINQQEELLKDTHNHVHNYGKADIKEGRKMGHVTRI